MVILFCLPTIIISIILYVFAPYYLQCTVAIIIENGVLSFLRRISFDKYVCGGDCAFSLLLTRGAWAAMGCLSVYNSESAYLVAITLRLQHG